ncbi:co-chaperone YbbN [Nocardioides sp. SYSU D00038]|uniref:thioredoxin family protein n=1 Tax=Nocardioides sp. SYSU D00038 TaxID=2812554 RepID=UPI001F07C385|nr:thioredoxin domain-containing protein [Nocardioides sp. SYSU D00038]
MTVTTATLPQISDQTFAAEVLAADVPVVVDLWAPWCPSCHVLTPILAEIAVEQGDRIKVVALNTDEHPVTAAALRVLGLPTLKVFRGGEEVGSLTGARPKRVLLEQLERILAG